MSGEVGIFWMVDGVLVSASCGLDVAVQYGDCLTYEGGHAQRWDAWQAAGGRWLAEHAMPADILTSEYDEHPRGRVVKEPGAFVIYADRRLQRPLILKQICARFGLVVSQTVIRSDAHYRTSADWT
jgi:hypothetical protein